MVVAAVFAFAVITTGLFSSEKATETAGAGLGEATTSLVPKGASVATGGSTDVRWILFKVTNAAGAQAVDLAPDNTLLSYSDKNQLVDILHVSDNNAATADATWQHEWKQGSGNSLDTGEVVQFKICVNTNCTSGAGGLANNGTALGTNIAFKIEIIPQAGAVSTMGRTIPSELKTIMDLRLGIGQWRDPGTGRDVSSTFVHAVCGGARTTVKRTYWRVGLWSREPGN